MGRTHWTVSGMTASPGKPRRVLIIVENLPVPFDRRVWQEASTLRSAGYGVAVICPTGKGHDERRQTLNGIEIYRYRLPLEAKGFLAYVVEYSWALAAQFWLALRVLREQGFDAIHACNPPDNIFLIGGFFKLFGKRFLFDHHDINPELFEAKFGRRGFLYQLVKLLERLTFMAADVSIATNDSYREIAISRGRMDPARVFVVRSGPELSRVRSLPPNMALKQGRRYLVGYVGVMGEQEGIDYLLRAARIIVHEKGRKDVHFGLVGGGTELEALQRYAVEQQVADYVTFTGRVADQPMLEMLSTADVCVNPDVANDMNDKSTMNKIMEYMALGKPVVQFDLTEGRRSAQEASLYARRNDERDLAEKILELLADEELRHKMGEFGRRRVENDLQWTHEAPKLLAAYDALLGPRT
jgi:glycosyltransferase involved in cell wall biosynthesis